MGLEYFSQSFLNILIQIMTRQAINITRLVRETGLNEPFVNRRLKEQERLGYIRQNYEGTNRVIRFREDSDISKLFVRLYLAWHSDVDFSDTMNVDESDLKGVINDLNHNGWVCQARGEYDNALRIYTKLLEINRRLDFHRDIADTLHWIARILVKQGKKQEALLHAQEALALFQKWGLQWERKDIEIFIKNLIDGRRLKKKKCHNDGDCVLVTFGKDSYVVQYGYAAWPLEDYREECERSNEKADWKCVHHYFSLDELLDDFSELNEIFRNME